MTVNFVTDLNDACIRHEYVKSLQKVTFMTLFKYKIV